MKPHRTIVPKYLPERRLRRIFAAVAGTVVALLLLAGPASASDGFRAQALAAGLSPQQATSLQAEVDRQMAKTGGVQTGPDVIDLRDGWTISVAIPGEAHPRVFNGTRPAIPADSCPHEYFCIYAGLDYDGSVAAGTQFNLYYCHDYPVNFGYGSWNNQETSGTKAVIINKDGTRYTTPGAPSSNPVWNWALVADVKPC